MIELTEEQARAAEQAGEALPVRDPRTNTAYILIRREVYDRLKDLYDDSPWTPEEADALALEAGKSLGWEEMDEYDDYPKKR